MFAKDAPFHFILASHLQPVDQVDHFEQNALQNEVGGVGEVEYSTPPRGNRAEGIPFRNRLCCYSGRLIANSCGRLVGFFVLQVRNPANAIWN